MSINQKIVADWLQLRNLLKERFDKKPDLNGVLYIIGIQELGKLQTEFSKEEKQDIMHVATCAILVEEGYFKRLGKDAEGWPIFEKLKSTPVLRTLREQEDFLRERAIKYFKNIGYLS